MKLLISVFGEYKSYKEAKYVLKGKTYSGKTPLVALYETYKPDYTLIFVPDTLLSSDIIENKRVSSYQDVKKYIENDIKNWLISEGICKNVNIVVVPGKGTYRLKTPDIFLHSESFPLDLISYILFYVNFDKNGRPQPWLNDDLELIVDITHGHNIFPSFLVDALHIWYSNQTLMKGNKNIDRLNFHICYSDPYVNRNIEKPKLNINEFSSMPLVYAFPPLRVPNLLEGSEKLKNNKKLIEIKRDYDNKTHGPVEAYMSIIFSYYYATPLLAFLTFYSPPLESNRENFDKHIFNTMQCYEEHRHCDFKDKSLTITSDFKLNLLLLFYYPIFYHLPKILYPSCTENPNTQWLEWKCFKEATSSWLKNSKSYIFVSHEIDQNIYKKIQNKKDLIPQAPQYCRLCALDEDESKSGQKPCNICESNNPNYRRNFLAHAGMEKCTVILTKDDNNTYLTYNTKWRDIFHRVFVK